MGKMEKSRVILGIYPEFVGGKKSFVELIALMHKFRPSTRFPSEFITPKTESRPNYSLEMEYAERICNGDVDDKTHSSWVEALLDARGAMKMIASHVNTQPKPDWMPNKKVVFHDDFVLVTFYTACCGAKQYLVGKQQSSAGRAGKSKQVRLAPDTLMRIALAFIGAETNSYYDEMHYLGREAG